MRPVTVVLVVFILGGCASKVERETRGAEREAVDKAVATHNATASGKDRVVCSYEQSTGTNFKRRVCRTVAEREQMQREAQELLGNSRPTGTGAGEN